MKNDQDHIKPITRRPVLRLLAGGAVAVAGIGAGVARLSPGAGRGEAPAALTLSSHGGYGVYSLDIPLDGSRFSPSGDGRYVTEQLPTSTHSMVAFTWARAGREPRIRIRSRKRGTWQDWRPVPTLHDLPDRSSAEGSRGVVGTDLVWIGAADGVQVEVDGTRPEDLTVVLLHPARVRGRAGLSAHRTRNDPDDDQARERVPRPRLRRRRHWGADRSWRPDEITYNETVRQVHVHHTVNSNDYSRKDVAGLIRGMYRYHTEYLGWSDIGYNFLVDRFGRTWVGRAGGPSRPVRGAHTLGFNSTSCGVSVIGNFETTEPNRAVVRAVARLAAWKLDRHGRTPTGRTTVRSEGSDRYAAGRKVRLPVIDGHRDTNETACPGRHLYAALPRIRRRAERIVDRYPDKD